MSATVSLRSHLRYLIVTDSLALLLLIVLFFAVSRIPMLLSPLAFGLLSLCCALGYGVDILAWYLRGIRAIELDDDALTLYRGRQLASRRVQRRAVANLRMKRWPGRRGVVLRLSAGGTVRIWESAFNAEEFSSFLAALESWR